MMPNRLTIHKILCLKSHFLKLDVVTKMSMTSSTAQFVSQYFQGMEVNTFAQVRRKYALSCESLLLTFEFEQHLRVLTITNSSVPSK